jgi:hypothetical protein
MPGATGGSAPVDARPTRSMSTRCSDASEPSSRPALGARPTWSTCSRTRVTRGSRGTPPLQLIDLVRVPPCGTWDRRRADIYGLADDWLGPSDVSEEQGQEHLVKRYLGGFGPAPLADVATWAGLPMSPLRPIAERLDLRRFRDERGRELLDLPDGSLPDPDTPAPVRFLPTWEATLLVHARRALILPEAYRPLIFNTKMPQSVPTFLVDGAVAGTWRYAEGRVEIKPFGELSPAARREIDDEAERLAAFHAG